MECNTTKPAASLLPSEPNALDTLIPGFSLTSRFLKSYLNVDLSYYVPYLIILAGIVAAERYCTSYLRYYFQEYFVSTAEIRLDDEIYNYLMFWMSKQSFARNTLKFVAGTRTNSTEVYEYYSDGEGKDNSDDEDDEGDDGDFDRYWAKVARKDKYKTLRYTPAEGTHFFWYKGRIMAFSRERDESQNRYVLNPERLYLSCLGRNATAIKDLLNEAQRMFVERDGNKTIIYRGRHEVGDTWWARCMTKSPRPLSTVVLDEQQKYDFVDDVKDYLHPRTRRWYSDRGIPYRRGYLFYGPPGTGKTSLCVATSGLLGLKIYLLNLSGKNLDENGLTTLFEDLPERCIVLLEDVDNAGMTMSRETAPDNNTTKTKDTKDTKTTNDNNDKKKEDDKSVQHISLSALLNVIDGVAASEGRILVMTTNHIEKLDPALLRPGRVDMTVCFDFSDSETIKGLFCSMYGVRKVAFGEGRKNHAKDKANKANGKEGPLTNGAGKHQDEKERTAQVGKEKHHEWVTSLADEFITRVPAGEFTPAEIQGYLLRYKDKPEDAIKGASDWVKSKREDKNKK